MRIEPHSGACPHCGEPVIQATVTGAERHVVLDPAPDEHGAYRAHLSLTGAWLAWQVDPDDRYRTVHFRGSRRRLHACHQRHRQLELGEELSA